jgi:cytoskeletal protein CcmA (bactofilin family)
MSDFPRRRLLDRFAAAPSLIASNARLVGDFETEGALLLNGQITGNGRIGGELGISQGGRWDGEVRAQRAVIAGHMHGTLIVAEKLEIGSSARISGRVTAKQIAMARGAIIDGELAVTGSEPIVEFEEKRVHPSLEAV